MNYLRSLLQPFSSAKTLRGSLGIPPAAMSQGFFHLVTLAFFCGTTYLAAIVLIKTHYVVASDSVKVINYDEMKKVAATGGVQVIDVRTPEEYSKGRIPNSVNIPVDQFEEALKMNPEDFKKKFSFDKPNPKDDIVIHCQSGVRSSRASGIAAAQGYTNVKNYAGGYKEWSEKARH